MRVVTASLGLPLLGGRPQVGAGCAAVERWGYGARPPAGGAGAANPADLLIVEGFPTVDPDFAGSTVLATQATTKQLQQAARQRQQTTAAGAKGQA